MPFELPYDGYSVFHCLAFLRVLFLQVLVWYVCFLFSASSFFENPWKCSFEVLVLLGVGDSSIVYVKVKIFVVFCSWWNCEAKIWRKKDRRRGSRKFVFLEYPLVMIGHRMCGLYVKILFVFAIFSVQNCQGFTDPRDGTNKFAVV